MLTSLLQKRHLTAIFSLWIALSLSSCGGDNRVPEGTIEYEVTYPYFQATGFMGNMLPDKMIMKFKGNKYKTTVKKGKAFSSSFIVDTEVKTLTILFQFGSRRKYATLDEAAAKKWLDKKFPKPEYMHTNEGDSIVGFLCRRSIAIFDVMGQPEAELMYTEDIGIDDPNWCLPYHEIQGVLLEYEVEQFGIRMRFTAKKFNPDPVDEKEFEVPGNYKSVPFNELDKEIEDMFSTITD